MSAWQVACNCALVRYHGVPARPPACFGRMFVEPLLLLQRQPQHLSCPMAHCVFCGACAAANKAVYAVTFVGVVCSGNAAVSSTRLKMIFKAGCAVSSNMPHCVHHRGQVLSLLLFGSALPSMLPIRGLHNFHLCNRQPVNRAAYQGQAGSWLHVPRDGGSSVVATASPTSGLVSESPSCTDQWQWIAFQLTCRSRFHTFHVLLCKRCLLDHTSPCKTA